VISPIHKLDAEQFRATFAHRMKQVGPDPHAMRQLLFLLPARFPEYFQG